MNAPTAERSLVAGRFLNLHAELGRFSSVPIVEGDLGHYEAICTAGPGELNHGLYSLAYRTLMGAQAVIEHHSPRASTPEQRLTRYAVSAARHGEKTPGFHASKSHLCLAAELKVGHSIQLHHEGRRPDHSTAAAVLFDVSGKPFAYSKSVDRTAAFAWREAVIRTASGDKIIPAGMFFDFRYGERGELNIQRLPANRRHHLISLENAGPPTDVRLFRFSGFLLDGSLAEGAYWSATAPGTTYHYLRYQVPGALNVGLNGIARQVQSLLRQGRVHEATIPS